MGCIVKSYRKTIIRLFLSTLAVCTIVSFFYSTYVVVDRYIIKMSENITITTVMDEDITADSLKLILQNIKSFYWVKNAKLIKPDSGLTQVGSNIGGISQDLLPDNPLPALINVNVKDEYMNSFNLAKYNLLLKRIDGVENTIQNKEYSETVFSIGKQFNLLSIFIGILSGLIVLLITYLSINPEFVKSRSVIIFSAGIKSYTQTAKEIFTLLSVVVVGSIIVSSGLLYLLWYLLKEELLWYMNTPWQVLLWNFSIVLIAFEFVFLILHLIYKPKKSITNNDLQMMNEEVKESITPLIPPSEKVERGITSTNIETTEVIELDSTITKDTKEETNISTETWEDDIT